MTKIYSFVTGLLLLCVATSAFAAGGGLAGVFGLNWVSDTAYLAVWVPVATGKTVTGVRWYQNDGATVLPEILVEAGVLSWPGVVSGAIPLATNVPGGSLSWSAATFSQPVTSTSGGLYIIFHLPTGSVYQHEGIGGGFGVGYLPGDGVRKCWMSGDGVNWNPMASTFAMAVEPVFSANKSLDDVLVLSLPEGPAARPAQPATVEQLVLVASPNPFNPQTKLSFSTPQTAEVTLEIFDVRGALVARLLSESMPAGLHAAVWDGRGERGQAVASGVYFARLQAGSVITTRRIALVK